MSVSCPEARSILASLNKKSNSTGTVYNAASISSVLNGMRNMDDNITEVRDTLKMMTRRLLETNDKFTAKDISNAAMVSFRVCVCVCVCVCVIVCILTCVYMIYSH